MRHLFKVGEHYRNRDGDYEVVSIQGSNMVIRYGDGRTIESTVEVQTRIWERIQEEVEYGATDAEVDDD